MLGTGNSVVAVNRIGSLAMIGDCHSAALVGRDGSIDWACFPRFDSPSAFGRMLDDTAGHFNITMHGARFGRRAYAPHTNVLVTTLNGDDGAIELTDCMPVGPFDPLYPAAVSADGALLRRVRCVSGEVDVEVDISPRFAYGLALPEATREDDALVLRGADEALWLTASMPLDFRADAARGQWTLSAGDEAWVSATWSPATAARPESVTSDPAEFARRLATTIAFWRAWLERCGYHGDYADAVHRSALALKALTYAPTGAVVAAATTSLPEELGGERNWDYRYTWIRDATVTLISLAVLGYTAEATEFKRWLERAATGRPQDLQIMYGVAGERSLPERTLDHLTGHRGASPVRIGNGAAGQLQNDSYGQILEAAWLYSRSGGELSKPNLRFLSGVADVAADRWRLPDHGIWEIRAEPRQFVHSTLHCWVAFDRAVAMAESGHLRGNVSRWRAERDAAREHLLALANDTGGWFPQAPGGKEADAAALLVPAMGFIPVADPLVDRTVDEVRSRLDEHGLLLRYRADDGVSGGEGVFLLCSFWLVDVLAHRGRLTEAEALLERLLTLSNDVGLFAEEADSATSEALGNFPQAFTHMALVTSAAHVTAAREGRLPPPDVAHDFAASAQARLLADGRV